MPPAMAVLCAESTARDHDMLAESQFYQKGVKHLCDKGVTKVPNKYILPPSERPLLHPSTTTAATTGVLVPEAPPPRHEVDNLKLPIVDLAELQGPNRPRVLLSLAHACKTYGFFQVVNHGIEEEVITKMREVGERFFNQPLAEREKYMSTDVRASVRYGTSFNQTKDGVFCWRDFLKLVCHPLPDHDLAKWPSSPSEFRDVSIRYARKTRLLFLMIVEAILESLGIKEEGGEGGGEYEELKKEMEDGSQLMVVNCYPPCPQPDLTLGMPPHSDYGFLTLVLQDEVPGLQILSQDQWLTIDPMPNSFVVNVGDHLEIFSNGRYKSVLHRVLVNAKRSRQSIASLHSLPFDSIVRPSPKLIDEANPRRYKDTDFGSFLKYLASHDSQKKNFIESRKLT